MKKQIPVFHPFFTGFSQITPSTASSDLSAPLITHIRHFDGEAKGINSQNSQVSFGSLWGTTTAT
jgi:hypothetical protein